MPNAHLKGAMSHQPRVTPWGNRNVTTGAPYRGKSFIVGGMLMPRQGGIITRHKKPKALPLAIWLLVLQTATARACIH